MRPVTLSRLIVAVATASLIAGCGFQLRGGGGLPNVESVRVNTVSDNMRDELTVFLEDGATRITTADEDPNAALLNVASEAFERRVLSVDPNSGKAREYELAYTVDFMLSDAEGKALVDKQTVRLVRDFVFDEDAVIGKSREESVLREEMRRDAMQQVIRRLRVALSE